MNKYGWNVIKTFKLIDKKEKGFIDFNSIDELMRRNKKPFAKEDFKALLKRFDHDNNQIITKDEFCDAILPNDFFSQLSYANKDLSNFNQFISGSKNNYREYLQSPEKIILQNNVKLMNNI